MNVEDARFNMIEQQIRPWEVLDSHVLEVMASVPREDFVPEAFRNLAFADMEIPLGHGQRMMPPKLEGRMLQALALQPGDRVLEAGTGSGYITACMARLAHSVASVELFPALSESAAGKLATHGITNVTLRVADIFADPVADKSYDAIAITGSMPIPDERFEHGLKVGGRLFVIVGESPVMEAMLVTRVGESDWRREVLLETEIPALINAPEPKKFTF